MKKQLRGRFRRNVETLLQAGMQVHVVAVRSRDDFLVGLDHPDLSVELVTVRSPYTRHLARVRHRRARRVAVVRLRLGRVRRAMVRDVLTAGGSLGQAAAVLRDQPTFRAAGTLVRPFPRWTVPFLAAALILLRVVRQLATVRLGATAEAPTSRRRRRGGPARHHRMERLLRSTYRGLSSGVWGPCVRGGRRLRDALDDAVTAVLKPFARLATYRDFWRQSGEFVRRVRPDLVVTSDVPGLVGAARAAHRLGIPHVHDCHELFLESTSLRWFEKLGLRSVERRHMRRAARVVAVNGSIAREYARRYRVHPVVVRNCTDAPEALQVRDLREAAGVPATASVVLYQGGFIQGRGLEVCVEAMAHLDPEVHLVLLGYGPLRDRLAELAEHVGVAGRVHLLPAVLPEDLLAYTASASVGVIPYQPVSGNNLLTLPNKIFEYTSVALPLVTSDLPELRQIVVGHGCGLVYDPYDAVALADALRAVLEPDAAARFRAAAQRFGDENSWRREQRLLLGCFTDALYGVGGSDPSLAATSGDADPLVGRSRALDVDGQVRAGALS